VEFGVLGPLQVVDDARPVPIPSAKQRMLLACLLLRAGELVTVDELAEAVWGDALPADPRRVVQTYVTRLRKLLGGSRLIQSRPQGYVLAVSRQQTDQGRFELLLERARDAAVKGDGATEAELLRQALALWRGEALADVPSPLLHRSTVARLAEQRLDALQRRIDADLALGRHGELVAELRSLTDRYPLREQLWAQLMLALYRSGRQADALEAYQRVRRLLADELGIDPGAGLEALHRAILTGDPALDAPHDPDATTARRPAVVPCQLPLDVEALVGRDHLVRRIGQVLADDRRVPVVALSGPPGVGKTALAIHAAHGLVERFPDGQLYVNLHGATAGLQPLPPLEVLGRFLRALGADPAAIPTELEEASAAFRSRSAHRRLLVVLDDAADAAQVVPLLPASPGCGVLVTSRRVLSALEGATHLHLDVLGPAEAVELLARLAGRERLAAERGAAVEVAHLCGHLPLALRIAGARLAARPAWPVGAVAERLADAQRRLDELELAEVGVRASFQVSYQQLRDGPDALDRAAAEAFGLLGVLDGPEVGLPVAARLLDAPEDAAERRLERLVDAQLLETSTPGRYRLHDLLRLYAGELARRQHPEPVRAAALTRALEFYVATAWQTLELLRPGDYRLARVETRWRKGGIEFADDQAALGWLEMERANLLAAVQQGATDPGVPAEIPIQLAQALFGFYLVRNYWRDWLSVTQTALAVAGRVGDRSAQAQAYNDFGLMDWGAGRYAQALGRHEQSLTIRRELGDRPGQAASLLNLGLVAASEGRYDQAVAYNRQGLAIFEELGDGRGQANGLANLGEVYQRQGRYQEALACLHDSLAIYWERVDRHGQANSLRDLGVVYRRQGRYRETLACLQDALAIYRELGDRQGQANSLRELGGALRALGRLEEARARWLEALAILEQLQATEADQVRALVADLTIKEGGQ
jgi:DNA-binding SARP family transcriptional activator/DNA polymerase III delta prime subunit